MVEAAEGGREHVAKTEEHFSGHSECSEHSDHSELPSCSEHTHTPSPPPPPEKSEISEISNFSDSENFRIMESSQIPPS